MVKWEDPLTSILRWSLLILLCVIGFVVFHSPRPTPPTITTHTVIHERVLLATNEQITELFISELLTPKSAACFRSILKHETNDYNTKAVNSSSGARGMGQLLASTYTNLGLRHSQDPLAQVVATLAYIGRKFGGSSATGTLALLAITSELLKPTN